MDVKNYVKRNVLNFKSQVLDPVYATKEDLASISDGKDGKDGKSAYEAAVEAGYEGTEEEFAAALGNIETMTKAEMLNILNGGES